MVSVILPVYNVPKQLVHCLESISAIDYAPLEVILVDDASTDDSGVLCEEFGKDRPENWGVVWKNQDFIRIFREARNVSLLKKYLWNNPGLPADIKRHPHYVLLKHRLYRLDYLLYYLL